MTARTFPVVAIALLLAVALAGWVIDSASATSAAPQTAGQPMLLPGCQASFNYGKLRLVGTEYVKTDDGGWLYIKALYQDAGLSFTVYRATSSVRLFVFYGFSGGRFSSSPSVDIYGQRPQLTVKSVYVPLEGEVLSYEAGQKGTKQLFCKATNLLRQFYAELKVKQLFENELAKQRAAENPAIYIK